MTPIFQSPSGYALLLPRFQNLAVRIPLPQLVLGSFDVFRLDHDVADDAAALCFDLKDELPVGGEDDGGEARGSEDCRQK